jgi:hypothetical protein
MESDWQSTLTGSANQAIRRSHRIASAPQFASAGSLFVTESDTESEASNEDNVPSTTHHEASPNEHTTMNVAPEILIDNPVLLPNHYGNQASIEDHYGTEMPRERHRLVLDGSLNAQGHQAPGTDTQYQAAEDVHYIERQLGPKSPHQGAAIPPLDAFDFGEIPLPQFFNEAFGDYDLNSPHHESQRDAEEATAESYERRLMDSDHMESFGNDPIVQGYVDLACRLSFRLPHEPVEDSDHLNARELLLPLVEERPLTSRLIHGLIYTLLPGPLRIFEVCSGVLDPEPLPEEGPAEELRIFEFCSSALDPEPSHEESPVDDFVAIVRRNGEALPLLVLGVEISKTLYILDSETVDLASLGTSWPTGPEWRTEHINAWRSSTRPPTLANILQPRCIEPHIESTLLSVWIAEACFQCRPIENVPSSRDLRLRFLGELLAPYQRDSVPEKCGIPSKQTGSQHVDTRSKMARLETQQTDEISVPNLENFELGALREALLQKPSEINRGRCLRILQCVNEIGSPHIIDSLKLACARKDEDQTYQAMEQPLFEKLLHIHIYLDKQESVYELTLE